MPSRIRKYFLILCLIIFCHRLDAQLIRGASYPKVGEKCPDFILSDVNFFPKKSVSLSDFKDRWLILDFWNKYCIACIKSFKKTDSLQKKYSRNLQFILIGYNGSQYSGKSDNNSVRILYDKVRNKQNLNLPIAYDSVLFDRFGVTACPHIILIDREGIIRAMTYSLSDTLLNEFLVGKHPVVNQVLTKEQRERKFTGYDYNKPFLINNNGGADTNFIYRSLLAFWDPQMRNSILTDICSLVDKGKFEILGVDLNTLYKYAYTGFYHLTPGDSLYGKFWEYPIIELADKARFTPNWVRGDNIFCYSLIIPIQKATCNYFTAILQADLKNYFGYSVKIENRKMPYWKLVSTDNARELLKTKSDSAYYKDNGTPHIGFVAKNYPIRYLLKTIESYHQGEPPFIDETGIFTNIDISLDALFTDLNDIKRGLQKSGLDLQKGYKEMRVMIITR